MLKCNYEKMLVCYIDIVFYKCIENVVKILWCGYEFDMLCYEDINFIVCKERIIEKWIISIILKIFNSYMYFSLLFYRKKFIDYKCDYLYIRYCYEDVKIF